MKLDHKLPSDSFIVTLRHAVLYGTVVQCGVSPPQKKTPKAFQYFHV